MFFCKNTQLLFNQQENEAAAAAAGPIEQHLTKSPSDFSCHSYELFVGQEKGNDDNNKEKMSIRSEGLESVSEITRTTAPTALASAKARKVSTVSMSECFACYSVQTKFSYRFVDMSIYKCLILRFAYKSLSFRKCLKKTFEKNQVQ